jgi:hypothetical protein
MYQVLKSASKRGKEWEEFSQAVLNHIEKYTVPQYGDMGEDLCSEWSTEQIVKTIEKYLTRFGKNSRPGQDSLDLLKIAHYACMAYSKMSPVKELPSFELTVSNIEEPMESIEDPIIKAVETIKDTDKEFVEFLLKGLALLKKIGEKNDEHS